MKVNDFVDYVQRLKGGSLNQDEGVLFGNAQAEVRGVLCTWMATVDALKTAVRERCNLVLCHEAFYFPSYGANFQPQHMSWTVNRNRMRVATEGDLVVMRVHGSLDLICVYDDFAAALGLENPTRGTGWNKVFPIPETTVADLVERIKRIFGRRVLRVAGPLEKRVRCVGLPWGGLGLDTNIPYMQRLVDLGADVFIAGEADEYGFTFANDVGVPLIETGHALSENIGIRNFTDRVRNDFPALKVVFFEKTVPFEYR